MASNLLVRACKINVENVRRLPEHAKPYPWLPQESERSPSIYGPPSLKMPTQTFSVISVQKAIKALYVVMTDPVSSG